MSSLPKVSFGFSKRSNKPKFVKSSKMSDETEDNEDSVDYIASFEDCKPTSDASTSQVDFLIPLRVSKSNIREILKKKYVPVDPGDELTTEAMKSLTAVDAIESSVTSTSESVAAIELDSEKHIENVDDADYSQVPIEKFGVALLKGMGLKETEIKKDTVDDYANKVRLKGLGLGADPELLRKVREISKKPITSNSMLVWKAGAKCQIVYGRHTSQYGTIEGMDLDIGRVVVRLASSGSTVKVLQVAVRLVPSEEFERFSEDLGAKTAAPGGSRANVKGSAGALDVADLPVKRAKLGSKERFQPPTWLREGLIVRYIDKKSKYYLQKVKVLAVSTSSHSALCSCKTEWGQILEGIRESKLEATVPKRHGDRLLVIRGQYRGEAGTLLERDERNCRVVISLPDLGKETNLHFDDVCCSARLH